MNETNDDILDPEPDDENEPPARQGKKHHQRIKRTVVTQKSKSKFRKSGKWLKFRAFKKKQQDGRDALTNAPLHSGFQVHHFNQIAEEYENLSVPENFVALNRYSHKLLHYLFTYYKKDPTVLNRLGEMLDTMMRFNGPTEPPNA